MTEKQIDGIGWGLFLIAVGAMWIAPHGIFPDGALLVALGATLLGLSLVRFLSRLPVSGFLAVLGALLVTVGDGGAHSANLPLVPLAIVAIGAWMILRSFAAKESV